MYNDNLQNQKKQWLLLTGGRCSEVFYVIKGLFGTSKQWPLLTGGRCTEVVVSSGLIVLLQSEERLNGFQSKMLKMGIVS